MKPETHQKIQRLSKCTFAPATAEKRFVKQISTLAVEAVLTEPQLLYLGQILYRYRKQMSDKSSAS